jgi:hypothetical protein
MRILIIIHTLLLPVLLAYGQVYIGTEPTGNPVLLEVGSTSRGVLIPRIDIPDTLSASPVTNPGEGLLVVNIHKDKEGFFFWNGHAWEKLKTKESVMTDLLHMGKIIVFVGTAGTAAQEFVKNVYTDVNLKSSFGGLTDNKAYLVREDAVYEITASVTGTASGAAGFIGLSIHNYTDGARLGYTTVNQNVSYREIGAKAIYCGPLKKDNKIGVRVFYGTGDQDKNKIERLKSVILSIKQIGTN